MSDERWIVVPNWDKFQHYSDRQPAWIKLWTGLRNKDEWRHLTLAQRGLLVSIWLEYVASEGQLRTSDLPSFILQKLPLNSLASLNDAGLITFSASKPLALRARARAREETEIEKEQKGSRQQKVETQPVGRANAEAYNKSSDYEPELEPLPLEQALEFARQLARPDS